MGYPPPPPPPGHPGYGPPPGAPPTGPPGAYGAPAGPPGGYGGPPPGGYTPGPPPGGGSDGSKTPLILLMAAIIVVVLLAVVGGLILVTKGGDGDVDLTAAQRTDALLTEGDIGQEFVAGPDDDSDDETPTADGACQETLDELEEAGSGPFSSADLPPGAAEAHFEVEDSGATIDHDIAASIDVVGVYETFVADCGELTFTDDDGTVVTFEVDERDAPDVGDDAVALDISVSADSDGQTIEIEGAVVAWTRDGNDSVIAYLAGLDSAAFEESGTFESLPLDDDLLEDIVTKADDKLAEVIDEA